MRVLARLSLAAPSSLSSSYQYDPSTDPSHDKVDHLVLIVHGIGKALQSFELLGLVHLSSIVDCCKWMRDNHAEVADEQRSARGASSPGYWGGGRGRTEYIPIEWHERFNAASRMNGSGNKGAGLNDISLDTIPHMRSFANDAMLDTLYFMSETHHDQIISLVVHELNMVVEKFRKFKRKEFGGKVSVVAHSLGSVITWDILANQSTEEGAPGSSGVGGEGMETPGGGGEPE